MVKFDHIKWVKNKILLQLLSNFVQIITFSELCAICNRNIQYYHYNLVRNISVRGENRRGDGALI